MLLEMRISFGIWTCHAHVPTSYVEAGKQHDVTSPHVDWINRSRTAFCSYVWKQKIFKILNSLLSFSEDGNISSHTVWPICVKPKWKIVTLDMWYIYIYVQVNMSNISMCNVRTYIISQKILLLFVPVNMCPSRYFIKSSTNSHARSQVTSSWNPNLWARLERTFRWWPSWETLMSTKKLSVNQHLILWCKVGNKGINHFLVGFHCLFPCEASVLMSAIQLVDRRKRPSFKLSILL